MKGIVVMTFKEAMKLNPGEQIQVKETKNNTTVVKIDTEWHPDNQPSKNALIFCSNGRVYFQRQIAHVKGV